MEQPAAALILQELEAYINYYQIQTAGAVSELGLFANEENAVDINHMSQEHNLSKEPWMILVFKFRSKGVLIVR
ncbi:MAG: hypothetical protein K0U24_09090 [Gammaproteobacteria bacterium]|nr:hypothetical protein [Gammaproteobacteria bacterium]